jgi:hypothetical protein
MTKGGKVRFQDLDPELARRDGNDQRVAIAEPYASLDELDRAAAAEVDLYADGELAPWWTVPYVLQPNGAPAVEMPRPLYAPANPAGQMPSYSGPDVQAYKRTVSRLGRWPWQTFDNTYSQAFAYGKGGDVVDTGVEGVQRQMGIEATGQLGSATFEVLRTALVPAGKPHAGEYAMDGYAVNLLKQAAAQGEGDEDEVRDKIAWYCRRALANEPKIHYQQTRPVKCYGVDPADGFTTDCSGFASSAIYWPKGAGIAEVPDPNGSGWNGYGYTGTLYSTNKSRTQPHNGPFYVGDLALYGTSTSDTTHVTICHVAGDSSSAVWTSHGSEGAPCAVPLYYRGDLVAVVRPRLVP